MNVRVLIISIIISFALIASITGQGIVKVIERELIDSKHDYWVIYVDRPVNRPAFRSYIRFFNTHTAHAEVEIDCSTYSLILYYQDEIIIRTTGHYWSVGDNYYVTIDEGALFSTPEMNSTSYMNPKFWTFRVGTAAYVPAYQTD